ncbi:MAG: LamG domain-containing protein, partial [Treponema sp.]|nr:LamG domain-containing protein [Treponema sp.]
TTVSVSFSAPNLTLTVADSDLPAGTYHISVTETDKTESHRLALTVLPYEPPAPIQSAPPAASATTVAKTGAAQKTVVFTLTSAHTGTWQVYNAPEGGSPLTMVSVSFSAPNLTLAAAGSDLPAGTYHISVTETGKTESSRLALTVGPYVEPGQSLTPDTAKPSVSKQSAVRKSVDFILTSAHTGIWKAYDALEGGSALTTVSVSFSAPNLTLTAAGSDLPAGTYYISVTETGKTESSRLALTVLPYEPPAPIKSATPTASVTIVAKTGATQETVIFTLTSVHTGTWKVYNAASGGTPLTKTIVAFSAPSLTLTSVDGDLEAKTYYVSVTEIGKTESSRLALTVGPYLDLGFLALRYEVNINAFTATPSSGAPWNAQLSGGAAIITEEGKQLVDTGGSNGYVDLGPQTGELLRSLSEFSIEIYVYVPSETSLSGNGHFIWLMSSTTQATQAQGSYMFLRASDQAFSIAKTGWGSGQTTENKGNIEKGWWKHIVVTRAADNTTTLYVNGTRISQSDAAAMTVDHSDLDALNYCYFAKPVFSGDNYLKNVRYYRLNIYNKALSSEEIVSGLGMAETLFALQKTPALQPASNLYVKTDSSEKFVSFILNNYPNASAVTVYDQASGNSQASAVTVSLNRNILTFTATGNDVPAGDYYITLTGEFARESDRTRLTVAPYVPPPKLIVISFTGIPSDPITVTGGGSISQSGGPLIISLSNAGDFTGVQWWLDGVKQASETGASYSIAVSGLSAGTHRVMVGASKNNIPYSGETSFIVTN